ncbi:MAG: ligase [Prosthecochloris sp.]|nr:ligase [Prosthecochloris sp.]
MQLASFSGPVFVVSTPERSGEWNMAFDRSLLELFTKGAFQQRFGSGSMLWRFYSWSPSAVSLGYSQSIEEIDREQCRMRNIDIVRRPTGGRAVLHSDEFTYSLLADTGHKSAEIYAVVHEIIRQALLTLGVEAEFCRTTPDMRKRYGAAESVSCFTASARNELHVDGRKLVGSAQRRTDNVILQHGSLLLSDRHKMLRDLLKCSDGGVLSKVSGDLDRKTISVSELTGAIPDFTLIAGAMTAAISQLFGVDVTFLEEHDLTSLDSSLQAVPL